MTPKDGIVVRLTGYGSEEYLGAVDLRTKILRGPLGLFFSEEELRKEADDIFVIAVRDEKIVGCLILTDPKEGETRMRQVAVDDDLQGTGIGTRMVEFAENHSRTLGLKAIRLHARATAADFYRRRGYRIEGEPFVEVGLPHFEMWKEL